MVGRALTLLFAALLLGAPTPSRAADARFDLSGPKIDVRVTRMVDGQPETLPIASVPNLQPGDKLWIHPDLPSTQSVKYLLICVFLRGITNPPPEDWFHRIETWKKDARTEGAAVTVPAEAQQVVLFLAPETGGDFSTLKSAVQGRPGVFVRASQDLNEAGFEQARIEKYLASIRRVPPSDADSLQKHSDLLARTLALKPNADCYKRPVDTQFTCLTQTGTQTLLDDGHGQNIVSALSSGANSDLIQAASYTGMAGGGLYSAYVGALVDLIRVMSNLHTAQYQYIPAIAFPQGAAMNLRLNTPPSFHNPKSVLVIGLPAIQAATPPPLRPADVTNVACLLQPSVVLPIEGAPLVFSTDLAHDLRLHLNTPAGAPTEPDIPLVADAFQGGLVLQRSPNPRLPLRSAFPSPSVNTSEAAGGNTPANSQTEPAPGADSAAYAAPSSGPIQTTGTILGRWGFDAFTGPTVPLQQRPGTEWHLVTGENSPSSPEIIVGHSSEVLLASTGTACVHTITAQPATASAAAPVPFKPDAHAARLLTLSLPSAEAAHPGDLHLAIQQYGQPQADLLSARTFSRPARIRSAELHAGDKFLLLNGSDLAEVDSVRLGDLLFKPLGTSSGSNSAGSSPPLSGDTLRLGLPPDAGTPPTREGDRLNASVHLGDGRNLPLSLVVAPARPAITLLSKTTDSPPESGISLASKDDLPLASHLTFTLKVKGSFPRDGQIEVETLDGTLRSVLTLAPSGGLLLQDPHTLVASLDPLRAFGPSAFGALHVRAVTAGRASIAATIPSAAAAMATPESPSAEVPDAGTVAPSVGSASAGSAAPASQASNSASDWIPLGTLVRLPVLSHLQCTSDASQPCTLSGSNLFLVDALSADPSFLVPSAVPDGFTGASLPIPHVSGTTFFLKLRDDPAVANAVTIPISIISATASAAHRLPRTQNTP